MGKHGKLVFDDDEYDMVRTRVTEFLHDHKNVTLNTQWDNVHFMKNVARLKGRCPCVPTRPECPCEFALNEVVKDGKCKCGLFIRKYSIYYIDSVEGDDANDGLSKSSPWKTLSHAYEQGSEVKLKCGSKWKVGKPKGEE